MPILPASFVNENNPRPDTCLGEGLKPNLLGFTAEVPRSWCVSSPQIANQLLGCPWFDFAKATVDFNFLACSNDINNQQCDPVLYNSNGGRNYTIFHQDLASMQSIFAEVLDVSKMDLEFCPVFGDAEINGCLAGPISSFPGLLPFIYLCITAIFSYLSFLIAECFFIKGDRGDASYAYDEDNKSRSESESIADKFQEGEKPNAFSEVILS
eukprot:CAMPEP_0204831810 /NCGR_PEP_ID=MMETSP1346-20131115/11792_1 /ASSEMBLY_ACC=CAM_ASM_000771 /TAXON_ID=215587 /ORGANISM="Aplanochytrium stocchinoi, Strain GSBS06" /LENGTH=210 /DNA_ID=CAMNT_0051963179 /DNA_START=476 /DNA_END=1108 /DNA_ORIENTATION=-